MFNASSHLGFAVYDDHSAEVDIGEDGTVSRDSVRGQTSNETRDRDDHISLLLDRGPHRCADNRFRGLRDEVHTSDAVLDGTVATIYLHLYIYLC